VTHLPCERRRVRASGRCNTRREVSPYARATPPPASGWTSAFSGAIRALRERSCSTPRKTGRVGQGEVEAIRHIALALPEVTERWSHGAPCFFVRGSRALCYVHDDHRGDGRTSLWCPGRPGAQEELVSTEPERFFRPPTSASGTFSNWVGVFLDLSGDDEVDWREIAAIIEEAYCLVAPKELAAQLEAR
jgi:hypothetical protein